jgi:hypothetical protein
LDYRFFNKHLSYNTNKAVKLKAAKLVKYDGVIAHGDMKGGLLYLREDSVNEYLPGGLPVRLGHMKFARKFYDDYYEEIMLIDRKKFYTRHLGYSDGIDVATMFLSRHAKAISTVLPEVFADRTLRQCSLLGRKNPQLDDVLRLADTYKLVTELSGDEHRGIKLTIKGRH